LSLFLSREEERKEDDFLAESQEISKSERDFNI